jgi:hypothetical protein
MMICHKNPTGEPIEKLALMNLAHVEAVKSLKNAAKVMENLIRRIGSCE